MNASNLSCPESGSALDEGTCALLHDIVVDCTMSVKGSDTGRVERGEYEVACIDLPLVLAGDVTAVDAAEFSSASLTEACETLARSLLLTNVDL